MSEVGSRAKRHHVLSHFTWLIRQCVKIFVGLLFTKCTINWADICVVQVKINVWCTINVWMVGVMMQRLQCACPPAHNKFTLPEHRSHILWASKLLLLQDLPQKSGYNISVHQSERRVSTFLLRGWDSVLVNLQIEENRRKKNTIVMDSKSPQTINYINKAWNDMKTINPANNVSLCIQYNFSLFSYASFCCYKYWLAQKGVFNLQLKIIPN